MVTTWFNTRCKHRFVGFVCTVYAEARVPFGQRIAPCCSVTENDSQELAGVLGCPEFNANLTSRVSTVTVGLGCVSLPHCLLSHEKIEH